MKQSNKLMLDFGSVTVVEQTLQNLIGSDVMSIVIVTGFEQDCLASVLRPHINDRVSIAHNADWPEGRASSIRCAVKHAPPDSDALLFLPGDKPTIGSSLINRSIELLVKEHPAILYVKTPAGRGHPIIFDQSLYTELASLDGDLVGNELIEKHRNRTVELEDASEQFDINTDADYQAALKHLSTSGC
jgi:molybdenum cofactor cytidylyltransferase